MTDPAGGDPIQQDVPRPSGTGFDDVREDAVERESAHDDDQPATPGSDVGLLDRADPDGSA